MYLFLRNDILTNIQKASFSVGFPAAYLMSLFLCSYFLKLPRFDFFNRILAINIIVYSFLGLCLSTLRLPLFSREVFLTEFLLTSLFLVVYYMLCHRLFPKHIGVMPKVDFESFSNYHFLSFSHIRDFSIDQPSLDGVVAHLRGEIDSDVSYYLTTLAQQNVPVYDDNVLIETLQGRIPLSNITTAEIDSFNPPEIYSTIKRVVEIALIVIMSPLLLVVSAAISIAIKIDSHGQVFFRQPRTGLAGTPFTIIKFRTMTDKSGLENRFTEKEDKRITRVGRVLRRLRFDELPQLWNVLKGDMSIIGPRPEQLEFTDRFDRSIPFYGFRHTIRPGITGWAQVMYGYADSEEQTRYKLEYDFFYIKHMSLWLDIVVLAKTIRTIFWGVGAR